MHVSIHVPPPIAIRKNLKTLEIGLMLVSGTAYFLGHPVHIIIHTQFYMILLKLYS